jgi:hypothetical protein
MVARGRVNNTFPWGKLYNPHLANHGSFSMEETDESDGFGGLAPVGSFPDGATATGILDLAGGGASLLDGVRDRVEHGQVQVLLTTAARRDAADDLGAVLDALFRVEGALLAGEALHDHLGVLVYENAHDFSICPSRG